MSVWGRLVAALRRVDPARLMAQGRAELGRVQRLEGPHALRVLARAIDLFQAALAAGDRAEATLALAQALRMKAERSPPEQAPLLRARAVAMLKALLSDRAIARDDSAHHRVLEALAAAWLPLPHDAPDSAASLALLIRARDTQSAAVAALDRAARPGLWAHSLLRQADLDRGIAAHPLTPDAARHLAMAQLATASAQDVLSRFSPDARPSAAHGLISP
ncbi:MAG: hypothetical protein V4712_13955 [Pseudomonadota bacterium]